MTEFQDKLCWVTGASQGIGRALALELAERGARVVATARSNGALEELAEESSGRVSPLALDVTDMEAIGLAVERVLEEFGTVDCLINNAGISQRSLIVDTGLDVFRRLMEVNYFGPLALTLAVMPSMRRAGSGHISVVGSPAGKFATPLRSGYCAAKHAAHAFFEALRAELAEDGIQVSVVVPGPIQSNITVNALDGDGGEYGRMEDNIAEGIPADVCARAILDGFARGEVEIHVLTTGPRK